jgi:hypothetical protein
MNMSLEAVLVEIKALRDTIMEHRDQVRGCTMEMKEMISRHERILTGNDGNDGLVTEVRLLKEEKDNRSWHIRNIWTALIPLLLLGIVWAVQLLSKFK